MTTAPVRILIVDDEPSLLKMMSFYLIRLGYQVVTAGGSDSAWAEVEASPGAFRVVVLDATMPGMPMADLAARVLASDPLVCVIACSGYPVDVRALLATSPGRVEFLHKPFSPEMLGNAVRRMIGTQETDV